MNYAKIEDGVCTNVIVADAEFAEQYGYILLPEEYGIGDFYDGGKWGKNSPDIPENPYAPADPTPTAEERLSALESAMLSMMGVNINV